MKYAKVLLAVLVFLWMQMMAGAFMLGVTYLTTGHLATNFSPETTAMMTILSGIISVAIIGYCLKMMAFSDTFTIKLTCLKRNFPLILLAIVGAMAGIFSTNLLSEQMHLPDMLQSELTAMSTNAVGIFSIAVVAPVIEELVFREAIVGFFLREGVRPLWSILVSALAFGLVHINPAQVLFAFLMGVVLAILYWRTRNILLCGFVHVLNNSLSVIQTNILGEEAEDFMLTDWVGGTTCAWVLLIASALVCVTLLFFFCRFYRTQQE